MTVTEDATGETLDDPGAGARPAGLVARGTVIDRYVILRELGAGGFGAVYEALDPDLDRRVALKVFHGTASATAQARFAREGKAIAALDHDAVVRVFDVGESDGRRFIAMELVEGMSLERWLEATQARREVLRVLLAAGHGLAAAHAAGLVHRDFKPANVLVGAGEVVKVADFGLARAAASSDSDAGSDAGSGSDSGPGSGAGIERVTRTGTVVGTPAYMAPEQFRGETGDARSDQFAFGVVLHEALTGQRPFDGDDWASVRTSVLAGKRRPIPRERAMPAWLGRIVDRALATEPQARFPTMNALLAELGRDRRRTVRRAAIAIVGIGVVTTVALSERDRSATPCAGAEKMLAGTWDDTVRARVGDAFGATGRPFAATSFAAVSRALDERAGQWRSMRVASCEATRQGHQSPQLLDLRSQCLETRRRELAATTTVLLDAAQGETVARAVDIVGRLPAIALCEDGTALLGQPPRPATVEARSEIDTLEADLARATALIEAARFTDAATALDGVVDRSARLGWTPLEARARFTAGKLAWEQARVDDGEAAMYAAAEAAARAHDDRLLAEIWVTLAGRVVNDRQDLESGRALLAVARTAEARVPDELTRARVLRVAGAVARAAGELDDARALWEESLAGFERAHGGPHADVAAMLSSVGIIARNQGKLDEARALYQRSIAMHEALTGPEHPNVSFPLMNLGVLVHTEGQFDEARALQERVVRIRQAAYPAGHINVAYALSNLGTVLRDLDEDVAARQHFERAIAMARPLDPDHVLIAQSGQMLAMLQRDAGEYDAAIASTREALRIFEKLRGPDHPDLGYALENLGRIELKRGRPADAIPHLERALTNRQNGPFLHLVAETRFSLAEALWDSGRDRPRAIALAREAHAGWSASTAADKAEKVAAIERRLQAWGATSPK